MESSVSVLRRLFSDAHVIDVDFSTWDRSFVLCIVGGHAGESAERLPVLAIHFLAPSSVEIRFRHHGVHLKDEAAHFQWNIEDIRLEPAANTWTVELVGAGASPFVRLQCRDVEIRQLPSDQLDRLFPGWNAPYRPLARPGIEALALRGLSSRRD